MEREVSSATRIGVMLIIMAAFINIVWFTVKLGMVLGNDQYEQASKLSESVEVTQLKSLEGNDGIIVPAAAAYNLVAQESSGISLLKCNLDGDDFEVKFGASRWEKYKLGIVQNEYFSIEESLKDHLSGKVIIEVSKSEANDGTFVVSISETD